MQETSFDFEWSLLNDHEICKANNRKKNFLTVLPIFTPSLYTNAFKALKTTTTIPLKCLVENQNIGAFE